MRPKLGLWKPTPWYRVIMSDGTPWAETSDPDEAEAKLTEIRIGEITTYADRDNPKTYGPNPNARIQQLFERTTCCWRNVCPRRAKLRKDADAAD